MNQWIRKLGYDASFFWAGVFFLFLSILLLRNHGMFDRLSLALITFFYLIYASQYPGSTISFARLSVSSRSAESLAFGCIFFFSLWIFYDSKLIYARNVWGSELFYWMRKATPVIILSSWALRFHLRERLPFRWIYAILLIWILLLKLLVLIVSPAPHIDVFTLLVEASDYFLKGFNPYPLAYVDIYGGAYDYPMGLNYPPGILIFLTPFRLLFEDIRVGYIFCDLIISLTIFKMLYKNTGKEVLSGIFALVFLYFPISFFMLEQSWIDPLIMLYVLLISICLRNEKFILAGVVLGLLCAVKQYVVFVPMMAVLYVWKKDNLKTAIRMGLICTLVFALQVLPFILNDWKSFYVHTFELYLTTAMRRDALSIPAMLSRWGVGYSGMFSILTYLGVIGYAGYFLVRSKQLQVEHLLGALIVIYGGVFIFGKQAFCGYYYLLSFMIYLLLIFKIQKAFCISTNAIKNEKTN